MLEMKRISTQKNLKNEENILYLKSLEGMKQLFLFNELWDTKPNYTEILQLTP